jgi:hypothetical protein
MNQGVLLMKRPGNVYIQDFGNIGVLSINPGFRHFGGIGWF